MEQTVSDTSKQQEKIQKANLDVGPSRPSSSEVTFIGGREIDQTIRMRHIFVRAVVDTPERPGALISRPLEEIVLMQKMYPHFGGKVTILGGIAHESYRRHIVVPMTGAEFDAHVRYLRGTYNNRKIQKRIFNFFDEVYGVGENCKLVEKMVDLVETYDPDRGDCLHPDYLNGLLRLHFPHVRADHPDDILRVPGTDNLVAPEPGRRAATAPVPPAEDPIPAEFHGDAPTVPPTEQGSPAELNAAEAAMMTGDPTPDPDLVNFLTNPEKTEGSPLEIEQAWDVARLVLVKAPADWDAEDMKKVRGLNGRNRPRIERLIASYLRPTPTAGASEAGQEADSDA